MKFWEQDETFLARWLTNTLTDEELEMVRSSPDFEEFEQIVKDFEALLSPEYDLEKNLEAVKKSIDQKRGNELASPPVRRISWTMYAAAASIILVVGFFLFRNLPEKMVQVYADEAMDVVLPDSSVVRLNEGSTLRYQTKGFTEKRYLYMDGEAHFDVRKGYDFVVSGPNGQVQVLGTSFNVYDKEDSLAVTCYTGKVRVSNGANEAVLEPGDRVVMDEDSALVSSSSVLPQPVWMSNVVQQKDVPLATAFKQLEEIYSVQINGVPDTSLSFTGAFPTNDLNVALQQVCGPFDLEYKLDEQNQIVSISSN